MYCGGDAITVPIQCLFCHRLFFLNLCHRLDSASAVSLVIQSIYLVNIIITIKKDKFTQSRAFLVNAKKNSPAVISISESYH